MISDEVMGMSRLDLPIYPKMKPQVLQSFKANQKDLVLVVLGPSSDLTVTPSSSSRAMAMARSRSVNLFEVAGKSRRIKPEIAAQPMVATPDCTINKVETHNVAESIYLQR